VGCASLHSIPVSAASIAGTSETLVSLLKQQLELLLGPTRDGYAVELFRSAQYTGPPTNTVSLLLYRVDVDEARRYSESPAAGPTLPGSRWLSPAYSWEPEDALRISMAPMKHEDMMRLWDGFDLPYQLSVPYLVRTVRLAPREKSEMPVTSSTLAIGSQIQP